MLSFINNKSEAIFRKIPESVILLVARFAIAAVFGAQAKLK